MASVTARLETVRARVRAAEHAAGRSPGSVTLIAVSKTKPIEAIAEAYAAGQRDFGESYAQELGRKADLLTRMPDIRWHFIGNVQRNKAKVVAKHAHVLHTLDSVELARELEKRLVALGRTLETLVEVNVSGEVQKHGVSPDALAELLAVLERTPSLVARGLMTVPPAGDDSAAERCFRALAALAAAHPSRVCGTPTLSMGLSDDLEIAVREGATHVRVGTAIFGPRDYADPDGPRASCDRSGDSSDA